MNINTLYQKIRIILFIFFSLGGISFSLLSCNSRGGKNSWKAEFKKYGDTLQVSASAYNTVAYQTKVNLSNVGAWGDTLREETKCIAVSPDLLKKGLRHNSKIKIKGLEGFYLVKDKMNARWHNRIDILMGKNTKKARNFGVKTKIIYFINQNKKKATNK